MHDTVMKKHITNIATTAAAVVLSTGLQAGEVVTQPMAPPVSAATCPWEITASALYLKAHSNEDQFNDQDQEFGYRLEVAYQNGGLGYRLRYFDWEGTGGSSDDYPEMTAWDLEVFDGFQLGGWDGEYAVGIRYATYEEDYDNNADFSGWGPTLGIELTHGLSGAFSVYAEGRASLVYGDDDDNYDDSFVPILELGAGIQYDINDCTYVRLGFEAQNWASISSNDNEDTGLFGGALEVGFGW
jgi:hypothetical protein